MHGSLLLKVRILVFGDSKTNFLAKKTVMRAVYSAHHGVYFCLNRFEIDIDTSTNIQQFLVR